MAGRTHLQQALPTTFGLKCATWALPFIGHLGRLPELRRRLAELADRLDALERGPSQ